ncbi:MAG TPA: T9SS type A sorting domain-containing protein [bacterium]|nr:T9SS type A sorting domain-containing protein [bacterium]
MGQDYAVNVVAPGGGDISNTFRINGYEEAMTVLLKGTLNPWPFPWQVTSERQGYGSFPYGDPSEFGEQGTSYAAPHVTGLIALMKSKYPELPAAKTREILEQTATDLIYSRVGHYIYGFSGPFSVYYEDFTTTAGRDRYTGYGQINAPKALIRTAIEKGLSWLRNEQNQDGSWDYSPTLSGNVGASSYAVLSLLNAGYTQYGATVDNAVQKAITFIRSRQFFDGSITGAPVPGLQSIAVYDTSAALLALIADREAFFKEFGTGQVYPHDVAIYNAYEFLRQVQTREEDLSDPNDESLRKLIGGWSYPRDNWSDLSHTQMALLALKACDETSAMNEMAADKTRINWKNESDRPNALAEAIQFLGNCKNADGGYIYKPYPTWLWDEWGSGNSYGSITAAGIWSAWCCDVQSDVQSGDAYDELVSPAKTWLLSHSDYAEVNKNISPNNEFYYLYSYTFLKAFTMYDFPETDEVYHQFVRQIYQRQQDNGSWIDAGDGFREYPNIATAFAILALQTKDSAYSNVFEVIFGSAGDAYVVDSQGRMTGIIDGQVKREIPASTTTDIGISPQIIRIGQSAGNYKVMVKGPAGGQYNLTVNGYIDGAKIYTRATSDTIPQQGIKEWTVSTTKMIGQFNMYSNLPAPPMPTPTNTYTITPTITATFTPTATFTSTPTVTLTATPTATLPAYVMLKHRAGETGIETNSPKPWVRVYNTGTASLDLSRVEIKYWYKYEGTGQAETAITDWAGILPAGTAITDKVNLSIVSGSFGAGQDRYLKITFAESAGSIGNDDYVDVQPRFNKDDWSVYDQGNDWSFAPHADYAVWDKITVYVDGIKVWGEEPEYYPTATITETPDVTETRTATPSLTETITATLTETPEDTHTPTATQTLTVTATVTPTVTETITPSATPTATWTITVTATPTFTLTPTATWTPTPDVVAAILRAQYYSYNTNPESNTLYVNVRIYNDGTENASLSSVTAKYWYTFEGTTQSENAVVDWAGKLPSGIGITQYVTTQIQAIEQSEQTRVQVTGFTGEAGSIGPGEYAQVQLRIHKNDWSNYTQTNDYSFGTHGSFIDWNKVTIYFDGVKVWGLEPGEVGYAAVPKHTPAPVMVEPLSAANTYNYPNPCGERTTIRFSLLNSEDVNILISDMTGKTVWNRIITAGEARAGVNYVVWETVNDAGVAVANGIYFLRISAENKVITKKIAVIR